MSFSRKVKYEICKAGLSSGCCAAAEAYGAMLLGNSCSNSRVRIITECAPYAERLPALFRAAFGIEFDAAPSGTDLPGKYKFEITDPEKISKIFDVLGIRIGIALHLNFAVLENDCCKAAFVRGAFLSGGSVSDPNKKYHLEIITTHFNLSRELVALLLEIGLTPRHTMRRSNYVVYFKSSESIEDFLTTVGAPVSTIAHIEAKLEKDMRNLVNRKVNCETGNLGKIADASLTQCNAIRRIIEAEGLDYLPEKLREAAVLRLSYPELPLTDLAGMMEEPVGRSGMNHRLRKLVEIAKELSDKGDKP